MDWGIIIITAWIEVYLACQVAAARVAAYEEQ